MYDHLTDQPVAEPHCHLTMRIDTRIKAYSRYQIGIMIALLLVLIIFAWLASLTLWQYMLLAMVIVIAALGAAVSYRPLVGLTQPELIRPLQSQWQLVIATSQEQLWSAQLVQAQDYGIAVVLRFAVIHPRPRSLSCAIFCDQVSMQTWHQLKVLGQLS